MVKKKNTKHRVVLIIVLLVVVIVAALFAIDNYNDNKEREMFMSLRADMKDLQIEFNKIDQGWEYSETCRGKGGDFDRNIPSSCALSITNTENDFSGTAKERLEYYKSIISNKDIFSAVSDTQESSSNQHFFTLDYRYQANENCTFESYSGGLDNKKVYLTVGCISSASEFYFPRNDL